MELDAFVIIIINVQYRNTVIRFTQMFTSL